MSILAHCPVLYAALREHSRLFFLTSSVNPKDVIRSEQCELAERMLAKPLSPAVLQKLKSSRLVSSRRILSAHHPERPYWVVLCPGKGLRIHGIGPHSISICKCDEISIIIY